MDSQQENQSQDKDVNALTPAEVRTRKIALLKAQKKEGATVFVRASLALVCVIVFGFVFWSTVVELDEIAVAPGEIIPSTSVKKIEHLEGGIAAQIHVENGQSIEQGQPIITLDGSSARAELEQMHSRLSALGEKKKRLRAFAETDFTASNSSAFGIDPSQTEVLAAQRNAHESERKILVQQLRERSALLRSKRNEHRNVSENVNLILQELEMRETLHASNTASKLELIQAKSRYSKEKTQLARVQGEIETTASEIAEFNQRIADLDNQMRDKALQQISQIDAEQDEVQELIKALEDRVNRLVITAPVSGLIQNLKITTAGQVTSPGGLVSEIVPLHEDMYVDAEVSTSDIGHVAVGHSVNVKLDAYHFARHGSIEGEVESISATTYVEESKPPFYKTRIRLAQQYLGANPDRFRLIPGMTVQADINTGNKTLFQYLMKPIYTSLDESFRER